jgi:hypothetical protein
MFRPSDRRRLLAHRSVFEKFRPLEEDTSDRDMFDKDAEGRTTVDSGSYSYSDINVGPQSVFTALNCNQHNQGG